MGRPAAATSQNGTRRLPVVDEHDVAEDVVVLEPRRAVAVRRVDVVQVGRRRLGDVRVGRDAGPGRGRGHDVSSVMAAVIAFMSK